MALRVVKHINDRTLTKVRLEVEDHIGWVTLHNPPVNVADAGLQHDFLAVCDHINQDDDIWVCILSSDQKTFCVGVDVKLFKQSVVERDVTNKQEVFLDAVRALYDLRVPVICAVHGHCLGGGLCFPASSDIVLAAAGAKFGIPEITLSVVGGTGHLGRLLPPMIMRDMGFTGAFITAEQMAAYGGVTQVVPKEDLSDAATAKARELCAKGPLVLRYQKACMNRQEDFQMQRKNDLELTYTRYMARHQDFVEGLDAYLEKRPPQFTGT